MFIRSSTIAKIESDCYRTVKQIEDKEFRIRSLTESEARLKEKELIDIDTYAIANERSEEARHQERIKKIEGRTYKLKDFFDKVGGDFGMYFLIGVAVIIAIIIYCIMDYGRPTILNIFVCVIVVPIASALLSVVCTVVCTVVLAGILPIIYLIWRPALNERMRQKDIDAECAEHAENMKKIKEKRERDTNLCRQEMEKAKAARLAPETLEGIHLETIKGVQSAKDLSADLKARFRDGVARNCAAFERDKHYTDILSALFGALQSEVNGKGWNRAESDIALRFTFAVYDTCVEVRSANPPMHIGFSACGMPNAESMEQRAGIAEALYNGLIKALPGMRLPNGNTVDKSFTCDAGESDDYFVSMSLRIRNPDYERPF